jgi:tetratricopeptide (TPR) repeat protein
VSPRWIVALAITATLASARGVRAQDVRIADSLLRMGQLDRAETEYYAAASARPRDPVARFALGQYLLDRGAFRIGATLIDEAMQFGYDKTAASALLARVYMNLGEYAAIERLPAAAMLPSDARARARWLAARSLRPDSADGAVLVAFARATVPGYLGAVRLRLDGRPIVALVEPRSTCGLRVADTSSVTSSLHRFGSGATASGVTLAVADSVTLGRMTIKLVPVAVERLDVPAQAIICFGMLARFAPTFDSRGNLMTLHGNGIAPPPSRASVVAPILDVDGRYELLRSNTWSPIGSRDFSALIGDRRWTFDPRRRQITIEP